MDRVALGVGMGGICSSGPHSVVFMVRRDMDTFAA